MEIWEICECHTQTEADQRLPVFLNMPAEHRELRLLPLLEDVDCSAFLGGEHGVNRVLCGGDESGEGRVCSYAWVRHVRVQCIRAGIPFQFVTTGAIFQKGGRTFRIEDPAVQKQQAQRSHLSYEPGTDCAAAIVYQTPSRDELWARLAKSRFRSRFSLDTRDLEYAREKGDEVMRHHAEDFVRMRLAPENPQHDGRQTPMRGHPVFKAQHATGCCCRECLEKWHHIPAGKQMTEEEQKYVVDVLMDWIHRQVARYG